MKKILLIITSILLLSLASAHQLNENHNKKIFLTENLNRYPIEDYKYGYTYRTTNEFKKRFTEEKFDYRKIKNYKYKTRHEEPKKYYYYKWSPYSETYKKIKCYDSPPTGKLFYRKCP